ncbi:MAG: 50S ribosomal protein L25 [Dehalococcoidia bacterium]
MAQNTVDASRRELLGKQVKQLRRRGIVPGNIYGHLKESVALEVPRENLTSALRSAGYSSIIDVSIAGEARPRPALIKQLHRHPVTDEILHVDFYQVSMTEKMTLDVPLYMTGEAPAVRDYQGVLIQLLDAVSVRCLPTDLPHQFEVDVSGLAELESSVHVSDLTAPEGVEILNEQEQMVARVESPRVIEVEEPVVVEGEEGEVAEGEEGAAAEGEASGEESSGS